MATDSAAVGRASRAVVGDTESEGGKLGDGSTRTRRASLRFPSLGLDGQDLYGGRSPERETQ